MKWEHGHSGYNHYGCRCAVCTRAATEYQKAFRQRRHDSRVLIGDRLVALGPEHGKDGTYTNWGCRCVPCCDSHDAKNRRTKERLKKRRAER